MTSQQTPDTDALLAQYEDDPEGFCLDVLGLTLWDKQGDIARSVATNTRTAVKSGHKIGKSTVACALALWWVMTRPRGKVVMTSSGRAQVKAILWKELRRLYYAAGGDARFKPQSPCPQDPATGLRFEGEVRAIWGLTTDSAERMQGFSGDQLLFIVDEASGFPSVIFEAIQGNMAGGGRVLATGNPTRTTGWFYDAFTHKQHLWSTFTVDSRTTPNCTGGTPIPGLAGPEWVQDMVQEYGNGSAEEAMRSPQFAVRVAGEFPTEADNSVIGLRQVQDAYERWTPKAPPGRLQLGVDPARFGSDDTVIWAGRGHYAYHPVAVHGMDSVQVVTKIKAVIADVGHGGDGASMRPLVKVDDTGGYGSGIIDALRRDPTVEVVAVNSSEGSEEVDRVGNPKFTNRRAQLWWHLREWLEHAALPHDAKAEAEILAPTYELDSKGRIRIEPKDQIKARIGRSPDRADALTLLAYQAQAVSSGVYLPPDRGTKPRRTRPQRTGRSRGVW